VDRKVDEGNEFDETPPNMRLKSMDPDVTVVVGGKEFYHYKLLLCLGCPFIDTMLSTRNNMKESRENRIEFPDKDPDEWETVYKYLDPTRSDAEKDANFRFGLCNNEDTKGEFNVTLRLLSWFDYLGMETLVQRYDKMLANCLVDLDLPAYAPSYESWCKYKHLPFPAFQECRKHQIKHFFLYLSFILSRQKRDSTRRMLVDNMKQYLLDGDVGRAFWQFLVANLNFPHNMLQDNDRATIVTSPLFIDLLEMLGKGMRTPKPFKEFYTIKK